MTTVCGIESSSRYLVHATAVVDEQDSFWRVALGGNDTACLLMSAKALNHLDFRV